MARRRWETTKDVRVLRDQVLEMDRELTATRSRSQSNEDKLDLISVTSSVDLDELADDVAAIGVPVQLKGTWDASAGSFPGSGSAKAGWSYLVTGTGTVGGVPFTTGDRLIAITDNASTSTYAGHWYKADYTDLVQSVDGNTGAIVLSGTYHPLMSQQSPIADPTGGATVDTESRAAVASILSALRTLGLIGT